jgi:oligopeptide transport system substrate-binding protein
MRTPKAKYAERSHGLAALCALVILLCGCQPDENSSSANPAPQAATPKTEPATVFRHVLHEVPVSIDPIRTSTAHAGAVVGNVYDTLYRYALLAEPYRLLPNLADGMPVVSNDGKTIQIKIKRGVYFHDSPAFPNGKGRELTADDVAYSFKRHFDPDLNSEMGWLWSDLAGVTAWAKAGARYEKELPGVRATERFLLEFNFLQAPAFFLASLAHPASGVVPVEAVAYFKGDLNRQAIGSGPFLLSSFDSTGAVLSANPNFRKEAIDLAAEGYIAAKHAAYGLAQLAGKSPPLIARVELKFIPEAHTSALAFERHEVDSSAATAAISPRYLLSNSQTPSLLPEWQDRLFLRSSAEIGGVFISFNMADPAIGHSSDPVKNSANRVLRCAISKAYSWDERREKIYAGTGISYAGAIPPGVPGFDPASLAQKTDLATAKKLLADAGWIGKLPTLNYGSPNSVEQRRIFELFRTQMQALGFSAEQVRWQNYPSFGAYLDAVNARKVMLMEMGWQLDAPDPENILQLYYGPFSAPQVNNANYQNPVFDAAFLRARALPAGPARWQAFAALNQILIDDCVAIMGFSRISTQLWHKNFIAWPATGLLTGNALRFVLAR